MYGSYSFQQIDKVGLKDNFHAFIVDSHHFTLKGPCHCCKFNCFFFCVFSYLEEAWLQPTSLAEFQMFSLVTTTDIHNQLQIDKYNNVVIILLLFCTFTYFVHLYFLQYYNSISVIYQHRDVCQYLDV